MASLAEAWSCVSCIFLGFLVMCHNYGDHRRWHEPVCEALLLACKRDVICRSCCR